MTYIYVIFPPICYINFLPISRFPICSIYSSSYILPLLYLLSSVLSFPRFSLHSSMKRNNLRISSYTWKKRKKLNEIKPRNATNTIHRANLFIYSENCSRTKRKRFIFFSFPFSPNVSSSEISGNRYVLFEVHEGKL